MKGKEVHSQNTVLEKEKEEKRKKEEEKTYTCKLTSGPIRTVTSPLYKPRTTQPKSL